MKIFNNISETIGNTPIVKLNRLGGKTNAEVLAKLEFFNPLSSVKDRISESMIRDAENKGLLKAGGIIVEPTSGNTGLGLAMVAASKGYKLIVTMPETMSIERQKLLQFLGAETVLTDGSKAMGGAIEKANEIAEKYNAFMPQQFNNPANPQIHYETTGPEIWNDTEGNIDILVVGIGTGGTISGTGKYLKEKNSKIEIKAVEPENSAVLSGNSPGKHGVQGLGAGFVPEILDTSIYNEIFKVKDDDAIKAARQAASKEGILCGISCGAAIWATIQVASREENQGKNILTILPDTGERYLSTQLFET